MSLPDTGVVAETQEARGAIETHSVDYIPLRERHGEAWHQFTLWFAGNAELSTLAVGLIGISLGLSLFWAIAATFLGLAFGTFFMAFHSVQGPRLGIAQMIQSRPQFGYYGALLPQAIAVFLYIGFNVFNTIIDGQALHGAIHINSTVTLLVSAILALVIAFGGYDWMHFFQRWLTWIFLIVFGVFTIGALFVVHLPKAQVGTGHFTWAAFLTVFAVTASYQLSEAPYVSDYSRYLRPGVTSRQCFLWTYAGSAIGSLWMMALGAFLLAGNPSGQTVDVVGTAADKIFSGFGTITLLVAWMLLLTTISLNLYCGSLSSLAIVDTVKSVRPRLSFRVLSLLFIFVLATAFALVLPQNFLTNYNNFLTILLYFLIPWTAVNLVDFYFVRKGHYAINQIFNRDGIYGRMQWRGLLAYSLGFIAMIPFFSTSLLTGPIAKKMDGADLSIFVGLIVAGGLYYLFARSLDHEEEQRHAEVSARVLESDTTAGVSAPA